jgi:uncharacterized repeat protein (TIGR03803 family)
VAVPAQTFTVLYTFSGGTDGGGPSGSLIRDGAGSIYGVAAGGSGSCFPSGCGVVFKLDQAGTESVIYTFTGGLDGTSPSGGVALDSAGNLYGTAYLGGSYGLGTVYEVNPEGAFSLLHTFEGAPSDGGLPNSGLVRDSNGNLYGATVEGGTGSLCGGCGTVFRVTAAQKETVLYNFTGGTDGGGPSSPLVRDQFGNLYGTTYGGGAYDYGTVSELGRGGKETVLYSFTGAPDGGGPSTGVIQDSLGNIYGTTQTGGITAGSCSPGGCGVVFKLDVAGNETVLHAFDGADGQTPETSLVRDVVGNLYGATELGGAHGQGVIFQISPNGTETVLHSFTGGADGGYPLAPLLIYSGSLYGTAHYGGLRGGCFLGTGCGVIFKVAVK